VGVYQVAKNLTDIVPQIVFALAVVVAPKLAAFNLDHKKAVPYLKKVQLLTLGLSVLGIIVGIPLGYFLIPQIYGMEYLPSIYPFIILIIAQAVFLISIPAHTSVIYYFSNPKLFLPISLGHLSVVGVLGWMIIPRDGYIGAAWVVLL